MTEMDELHPKGFYRNSLRHLFTATVDSESVAATDRKIVILHLMLSKNKHLTGVISISHIVWNKQLLLHVLMVKLILPFLCRCMTILLTKNGLAMRECANITD